MKLAIHHFENSFSERWINYCEENGIDYKLVNCYSYDIIEQMQECDTLLWNWYDGDYKTKKFAKQLTYSLEMGGKVVFPNSKTCWHYDDKVGQKYLLESIEAPFIPTYVFYDKDSAFEWINTTTFPKVFKLSVGSGANNVQLVHDQNDAKRLIGKAFEKGFSQFDRTTNLKDKYKAWKRDRSLAKLSSLLKSVVRLFVPTELEDLSGREVGYIYFQEFIPNNKFDIRVVTTGNRAFALKRFCREDDFRASGSGIIEYKKEQIDERCVKIALEISKKLDVQSMAYDFVFDSNNTPLIVEMSYTYTMKAYDNCEGYWDENLKWHNNSFNPQVWMIEDVISICSKKIKLIDKVI